MGKDANVGEPGANRPYVYAANPLMVPRTSEIHDWRERGRSPLIAEHGYEGAVSADQDQQAQAASLFTTDMLAASIGQG